MGYYQSRIIGSNTTTTPFNLTISKPTDITSSNTDGYLSIDKKLNHEPIKLAQQLQYNAKQNLLLAAAPESAFDQFSNA